MEKEESTTALLEVLKTAGPADLPRIEKQYLSRPPLSFAAYMDQLLAEKGYKRQQVFQRANLPQKYGYKLLTGESRTSDRDKLLRLFFAMQLSLQQVQRALALYGMPQLYAKKKRDAIFMLCLNRRLSVDEVNELLRENQEQPLRESKE